MCLDCVLNKRQNSLSPWSLNPSKRRQRIGINYLVRPVSEQGEETVMRAKEEMHRSNEPQGYVGTKQGKARGHWSQKSVIMCCA